MKAERVARRVTRILKEGPPEEWRARPAPDLRENWWEEDHNHILQAVLSRPENVRRAKRAVWESLPTSYTGEVTEDLFHSHLMSPDWWELFAFGILDGYDFRVWSMEFEDKNLHFIVVTRSHHPHLVTQLLNVRLGGLTP